MVHVAAADEPDPLVAEHEVLQLLASCQADPVEPREPEQDRRVVHEENGRRRVVLLELRLDPLDLVGADVARHLARHVGVEAEAQRVACGERELDALGALAGDSVGERRAERGAVLVVPGHEPGAVVPWPQDVAHGLVRDRQIVVRVIPGDDEVVDPPGVLLDVGDHVLEQLAGRDLVEASVGIRVEVQVGQLDDAGQGHLAPVCTNRPTRTTPPGRAPVGTPSRRVATPFTHTPATPSGDRAGSA